MNSLQKGWMDYSNEHRNKVLAVLDALLAPEVVDKLGAILETNLWKEQYSL